MLKRISLIFLFLFMPLPVWAQTANYGTFKISNNAPVPVMRGETGGSYSLLAIANEDKDKNKCLGFGTNTPDFILDLEQDLTSITILVNSGGQDTTILVKKADRTVVCGDDTGTSKDANIADTKWKAGIYEIWVGSIDPGMKIKYSLTINK